MIATIPVERSKTVLPDGANVEIVVWKVPEPVSPHLFKYRLFYGKDGRRFVGFDNKRGKAIIVILTAKSIPTCSQRPMPSCPIFGRR